MGALAWSKSARVPFAPDAVFNWMTDFQEDDHARPAFIRGSGAEKTYTKSPPKRTVLARQGNTVKIHDEWGRNKFDTDLELVPLDRAVKMKGPYGYEAAWRAVPDGDGTKLEASVTVHARGLVGFFFSLFKKKFYRDLDHDFAGHLADLEDALKAA